MTPNFVHKGVNLKIRIDATIKTKVDSNSRTSLWISEVLNALKQVIIRGVVWPLYLDKVCVAQ